MRAHERLGGQADVSRDVEDVFNASIIFPGRLLRKTIDPTSTCVKSSGLVESRLDVAFPLGLDARWQYNWKSIRSTTLFGCCVSIGVRCKMSPSAFLTLRSDWGSVAKTLQTST